MLTNFFNTTLYINEIKIKSIKKKTHAYQYFVNVRTYCIYKFTYAYRIKTKYNRMREEMGPMAF